MSERIESPDGDDRKAGTITDAVPISGWHKPEGRRLPPEDHAVWNTTPHLLIPKPGDLSDLIVARDLDAPGG